MGDSEAAALTRGLERLLDVVDALAATLDRVTTLPGRKGRRKLFKERIAHCDDASELGGLAPARRVENDLPSVKVDLIPP